MGMDGERATTSRRRFLGTAAGATGVALGAAALGGGRAAAAVAAQTAAPANAAPAAIGPRAYSAGHFALELDQALAGFLKNIDGGGVKADVIELQSGTGESFKHIANIKYEDIAIDIGFSLGKPMYDWITASWNKQFVRKNGAIVAADFSYDRKMRREFTEALLTEVSFPALDAASKDAGALTVMITPEQTQTKGDSGKLQAPTNTKQKQWTPANFRLELSGLDCTRVSKVDAFAVKQKIVEFQPGDERLPPQIEPGKLEFPDLTVTFASTSGQTWSSWFEDFVIKGNSGSDKEKTGKIVFLASNMTDVLAEIHLFGVGIFQLEDGVFDAVNEPSAMMRAHLYVERMAFIWFSRGSGTTPSPTPPPDESTGTG
jgi:phage tail-like protein